MSGGEPHTKATQRSMTELDALLRKLGEVGAKDSLYNLGRSLGLEDHRTRGGRSTRLVKHMEWVHVPAAGERRGEPPVRAVMRLVKGEIDDQNGNRKW
jgi:hypothetical protein